MPSGCFCPYSSTAFLGQGKGKERTRQLLLKALPTALARGSEQQERAGSGPKHRPWTGPLPALPSSQSLTLQPLPSLLLQGVRIPTLGSFDAVPQWIQAGNEAVIIQRPVFRLARNLAVVHNLMDDKDYLPGKTSD